MTEIAPPPAPPPPAPPPSRRANGFAVASLVLGILSIVLFFMIWVPVVLGILAIVFGAVGISNAKKGAPHKGMAIGGLVCGAAGIVAMILFIALVVSVVNDPNVQRVVTSILQSPSP